MPNIHIFCDASPQARGIELFAASWDLEQDGVAERRLFPIIRLSRRQLTAAGKLSGLLWMMFLVSGQSLSTFMSFLTNVRSIVTDFGVERLLVDQPNCVFQFLQKAFPLTDFFRMIKIGSYVFPKALHMPGWRHLWDGVLRQGIYSLHWFPRFLKSSKV